MPILRGFVAESADSIPESADSTTDFTIVGLLSISNMFNIRHRPSRPTRVGRLLPSAHSNMKKPSPLFTDGSTLSVINGLI